MSRRSTLKRRLMCTEAIQVSCPQPLLLPQHTAKASAHRRPLSHPDTHSETHTQIHTHTDTHTDTWPLSVPLASCWRLLSYLKCKQFSKGRRNKRTVSFTPPIYMGVSSDKVLQEPSWLEPLEDGALSETWNKHALCW